MAQEAEFLKNSKIMEKEFSETVKFIVFSRNPPNSNPQNQILG